MPRQQPDKEETQYTKEVSDGTYDKAEGSKQEISSENIGYRNLEEPPYGRSGEESRGPSQIAKQLEVAPSALYDSSRQQGSNTQKVDSSSSLQTIAYQLL